MGMVVSFAFIPIFLLAFALPVFIGVYVYRDATKRGMNGVLWMLVAILAPTFIGLIIYLLVRSNYSDMRCPTCDTRVTETFMVCPNCGTKLRPTCPSCATPVQPEWKVCPQCAEPLPTTYSNVTSPEKPKDKTLSKILIAVLLVPALLVLLIVVLLTVRRHRKDSRLMVRIMCHLGNLRMNLSTAMSKFGWKTAKHYRILMALPVPYFATLPKYVTISKPNI